jgi:branched-chain amino acid transport system ATP-binding protein
MTSVLGTREENAVEAAVEVRGLTKRFGGVTALTDVDIRARRGAITALIGPNGSGKSTTINVVTGIYRADAGEVTAFGRDISTTRTAEIARMGIVRTFQTPRLFPGMTVLENALAGAHMRVRANLLWQAVGGYRCGRTERELRARALELLEIAGLADKADENAAALSTGSQKLLDLVRALMARPQVLLLDEPAAGLNDTETDELGTFLAAMREVGLTVVFVEHNMSLVLAVSDEINVLHEGRVVFSGTPQAFRGDQAVSDAFLGKVADGQQ